MHAIAVHSLQGALFTRCSYESPLVNKTEFFLKVFSLKSISESPFVNNNRHFPQSSFLSKSTIATLLPQSFVALHLGDITKWKAMTCMGMVLQTAEPTISDGLLSFLFFFSSLRDSLAAFLLSLASLRSFRSCFLCLLCSLRSFPCPRSRSHCDGDDCDSCGGGLVSTVITAACSSFRAVRIMLLLVKMVVGNPLNCANSVCRQIVKGPRAKARQFRFACAGKAHQNRRKVFATKEKDLPSISPSHLLCCPPTCLFKPIQQLPRHWYAASCEDGGCR